ncbi:enoyl-CoA hydratase-related protein [Rhodococcoides fascians]|uniref:enoyl-CoA hydratase-related protein n=1 Tax=Rhodococcoides fascians TaxID=1828 RepID=UPI00056B560B|nr:enoyl-CoA hydratase-related protein [Rhodococcus fascians]
MTATLDYRGDIAIVTLGDDFNVFAPDMLDSISVMLDRITSSASGLVTIGSGKFYSNGLDLAWLKAHRGESEALLRQVEVTFAALLTLPMPTVAAVNGHAFGAGAMLALAHDYRVMREDRGFFCFPEVDVRVPFSPGMAALIQSKASPRTTHTAMTEGHRYAAADALAAGLVDITAPQEDVLEAALTELARVGRKDPATLKAIKTMMYQGVLDKLRQMD